MQTKVDLTIDDVVAAPGMLVAATSTGAIWASCDGFSEIAVELPATDAAFEMCRLTVTLRVRRGVVAIGMGPSMGEVRADVKVGPEAGWVTTEMRNATSPAHFIVIGTAGEFAAEGCEFLVKTMHIEAIDRDEWAGCPSRYATQSSPHHPCLSVKSRPELSTSMATSEVARGQ